MLDMTPNQIKSALDEIQIKMDALESENKDLKIMLFRMMMKHGRLISEDELTNEEIAYIQAYKYKINGEPSETGKPIKNPKIEVSLV